MGKFREKTCQIKTVKNNLENNLGETDDMTAENEKLQRGKLFAAAWRGEFDGVKNIIEDDKGINIDSCDENGVTALRFTAQFGHYEITEYLLNKGANPNIKAHDELDPLMSAVENGDKKTVILLIDKG